ncbi:MAG: dUTPase [Bacillota bacterium]
MVDIENIINDENSDRLDVVFNLQKAFDTQLVETRGLQNITREEWIQKEILAMLSELSELLDEVNFKWWKNKKEINEYNIKEELIDIMHFFFSACIKMGMSAEEIYDIYIRKNRENFARQNGTSQKKGYEIADNKE